MLKTDPVFAAKIRHATVGYSRDECYRQDDRDGDRREPAGELGKQGHYGDFARYSSSLAMSQSPDGTFSSPAHSMK